jgi:hypothetical protein
MIKRPRLRHLLAAAVTVGALASAVPAASASTSATSGAPAVTTSATTASGLGSFAPTGSAGALGTQTVSPAACGDITAFGYAGKEICGYSPLWFTYPDGHQEVFVVGTNYAVFHAWSGSNGWHSLGGTAISDVYGWGTFDGGKPIIEVVGTNGLWYCDAWGSPSWTGWFLCD